MQDSSRVKGVEDDQKQAGWLDKVPEIRSSKSAHWHLSKLGSYPPPEMGRQGPSPEMNPNDFISEEWRQVLEKDTPGLWDTNASPRGQRKGCH